MNKYSSICVVAIIMLSSVGLVAAQDEIKCVWEPCGTKVEQADIDAVYRLTLPEDDPNFKPQFAYFDYNMPSGTVGEFDDSDSGYIDMNGDGKINPGDVRVTAWHNVPVGDADFKYPPNTKVFNDLDQDLPLYTPDQDNLITYIDVNDNSVFDLNDPMYIDTDYNRVVSSHDIRLTANVWGYVAYSTVSITDDDEGKALDVVGTGVPGDMLGYIDSDCSEDWTCPDKLYLQQPKDDWAEDHFVTIGDLRLYIPQDAIDNEEWPSCGTRVEQGDIDAVYVLRNVPGAMLRYYDFDGETGEFDGTDTAYVDMNGNGLVDPGDVRLTGWHNDPNDMKYPPNSKVFNDLDQNLPLTNPDGGQANKITYFDENGKWGYDLTDPVYVDMDNNGVVSLHDIRLTATAGYAKYTTVAPGDADLIEGRVLQSIGTGVIADLIGYIDSDCNGHWSCPDKLYLEQPDMGEDTAGLRGDGMVTIGDLRLYIPQEAIDNEEWPECGTKVQQCDIDAVYVTKEIWENGEPTLRFYDYTVAGQAGIFDNSDTLYIDMDNDYRVSQGDVRLTPWHNVPEGDDDFKYPANTKVGNDLDLNQPLLDLNAVIMFYDMYEDGYDLTDPVYVNIRDPVGSPPMVSTFDVRLTTTNGFAPYTTVMPGDSDMVENRLLQPLGQVGELIGYIDSDCSNSWTCPDKLYLDQQFPWVVSIGDLRLYIPPEEIIDPFEPCDHLEGDVNNDGVIAGSDALMVARHVVGLAPLTGDNFDAADVDDSGTVGSSDALMIAQYVVGLRTTFPGGECIP